MSYHHAANAGHPGMSGKMACRETWTRDLTGIKECQHFTLSQFCAEITGGRGSEAFIFLKAVLDPIIGLEGGYQRFCSVRGSVIRDDYLKLLGGQGFGAESFQRSHQPPRSVISRNDY